MFLLIVNVMMAGRLSAHHLFKEVGMQVVEPLAVIKVDGENVSLYEEKQVAILLKEKKLPYEALEILGEVFPNVYAQTVKLRLEQLYGVPTTIAGALIKGKDNMNYLTMERFVAAMDYDYDISEMVCNTKNNVFRQQIMDIGYPLICLMTRDMKNK